jgi:DNA-binding MarR family transcriptional regulator
MVCSWRENGGQVTRQLAAMLEGTKLRKINVGTRCARPCGDMTGGKQRCWEHEEYLAITPRYVPVPPNEPEAACDDALEAYRKAQAFELAAQEALREEDLTWTEWRILHAAATAIRLSGDAVSQLDIARRAQLSAASVSRHAWRLQGRGLLDAAPDCMGFAYRILVTDDAKAKLAVTRVAVARVAAEIWPRVAPTACAESPRQGETAAE